MINIKCKCCNKDKLIQERYLKDEGNYCSKKCMGLSLRLENERNCQSCNVSFYSSPSRIKEGKGKFCSKNCKNVFDRRGILGEKIGKLTPIKMVDLTWECICDCGNTTKLSTDAIRSGKTKSCGCGRSTRKKKFGEARINAHFSNYRTAAIKRNKEFLLNRGEFEKIVLDNCYYCGNHPKIYPNNGNYNGNIPVNGIDRKDNAVGYTLNNCVPCCSICNFMKVKMSDDAFLSHVEKISEFQKNKMSKFPISYLTVIA